MRAFVREEVWPIEAIEDRLTQADLDRINAPLQEQVKQRGLWAAHLPPELGGQGFGQVKLGLMNEILGTSIYAPRSEEHTSELQSHVNLVCRLLLEKKKKNKITVH